jgi:hypothetical protein
VALERGSLMSSIWLRINGTAATEIAAHTPPKWETWADGGCWTAEFAFAISARHQHQALKAGAFVEILRGPVPLWCGLLADPDRTTWQCTATGLAASLRTYLALDGGGNTTRNIGTAVTQAIARGWRGTNPLPITGTAAGEADGNPVTVGQLLDDYAEQTGQRWGVDGAGVLYMRPDPAAPSLLTAPGTAVFGQTSDDTPKRLAGRFFDGTDYLTAFAGTGAPEEQVDLTDRGTLTLSAAEAILAGMLTRQGEHAWTNSVRLHRNQLTTMGGEAEALASVVGGRMLRGQGLSYGSTGTAVRLDVVLGRTEYDYGDPEFITVEPINTAPRTLRAVGAAS